MADFVEGTPSAGVPIEGDVNVEFEEAASRQQLNSGESVKTLFGKLRKFLTDLKAVAFSGSYGDLSDKPTIDSTLSSTSTNAVQNKAVYSALSGKANSSHTHSYAGSASAGGSANSAVKLDSSAGSSTQPIYFSAGKPIECKYSLNKSVPSDAVFTDTVIDVDTALSASSQNPVQNKVVKTAIDSKVNTATIVPMDTYKEIMYTKDSSGIKIGTDLYRKISDGNVERYIRILSPDGAHYSQLYVTANDTTAIWNFTGDMTTALRVNGKTVFTDSGYVPYIVGTFSGTGGDVTVSGLSFTPSRTLYYALKTGETALTVAKKITNGFTAVGTSSGVTYEYIAFR